MLDAGVPNNSGVFRCIEVKAPAGSILNASPPAPVAARALTGYRVVDLMLGCLAQIVPERIPAAGEGGNTVVCIGGYDQARRPFVMVDMINGAWGGRPDKDGIEAITNPSQNMSNTPVEVLEAQAPGAGSRSTASPRTAAAPGAFAGASGSSAAIASWPRRRSSSCAPTAAASGLTALPAASPPPQAKTPSSVRAVRHAPWRARSR